MDSLKNEFGAIHHQPLAYSQGRGTDCRKRKPVEIHDPRNVKVYRGSFRFVKKIHEPGGESHEDEAHAPPYVRMCPLNPVLA
jgi:hypothetical protein